MDDDDMIFIGPKEDTPTEAQTMSNSLQNPDGNEVATYLKELDEKNKKEKEKEEEEKMEKKKQFDLDLKEIYSFSLKEYKKPPLVVLENEKQTTYMSCVLQCLGNIESIAKNYLKELTGIKKVLNEIPFSYSFSRIIFHLYPDPRDTLKKVFNLSNFYNTTIWLKPYLKGESTKSATSFLMFALDRLHDDYKIYKKFPIYEGKDIPNKVFNKYMEYLRTYEKTLIFDIFGWVKQESKKCLNCNYETVVYRQFLTFDVNIEDCINKAIFEYKNEITIYECIKYQCQKERIDNIYCKNCQNKFSQERESLISLSPNYFVIILALKDDNKSSINEMNGVKIKVDNTLFLGNIIKEGNSNIDNYLLVGMVCCDLIGSKEYVAYCYKLFNNKANWYKYDKSTIEKVGDFQKDVLETSNLTPVILFYKSIKEN